MVPLAAQKIQLFRAGTTRFIRRPTSGRQLLPMFQELERRCAGRLALNLLIAAGLALADVAPVTLGCWVTTMRDIGHRRLWGGRQGH